MPTDRGMDIPWEEIQAEDAETNGRVLGPCRMKWSYDHLEAEAIGRKAVVLLKEGDYVRFKPKKAHNSIVVRYSVPDTQAGGGDKYTLGLFVNGKKATSLELTSLYSWNYKGQLLGDPSTDTPAESPHTFYDEARFIFPEAHTGDTIELRREGGDKAGFYVIDLADFEAVPPPNSKPEGFIDVRDYGIKPDDGLDHAADLERLLFLNPNINADPLHNERKLYFPPGTYIIQDFKAGVTKKDPTEQEKAPLDNEGLDCHDCEIRGAGMWHTRFTGRRAMFFCLGQVNDTINVGGCHFKDFSIIGVTKTRSEEKEGPQKAFAGPLGSQSTIDNVWIEHVVAGIWVGNDPPDQARPTENLHITNCRIRNTFADGINFANGTSNSSAENCHIRSTGDDGIAVWSVNWPDWVKENPTLQFKAPNAEGQGVGHGNHFNKISVQMPWRANCFAVYGGSANTFENSTCEDVLTYPGILVDNEFSPYPFGPDVTTFRNITLNRAGGPMFFEWTAYPWQHAAIEFYTREGDVNDILIQNVDVIAPTFAGISFKGFGTKYVLADPAHGLDHPPPSILADADKAKIQNVTLNNVKITDPGTVSVELLYGAGVGKVNLQNVQLSKPYMQNTTESDLGAFFAGQFSDSGGSPLDTRQIASSKTVGLIEKRDGAMNSHFRDAARNLPLSADQLGKLKDPNAQPYIPKKMRGTRTFQKMAVPKLYPSPDGNPKPLDGIQTYTSDCGMITVFNALAYQAPEFIKKIIRPSSDLTRFEVDLFDPKGSPVTVVVDNSFPFAQKNGFITGIASPEDDRKKAVPNWMSVLEKAIMKYETIYAVGRDFSEVGQVGIIPPEVVSAILTGDGNNEYRDSKTFKDANDLRKTVTDALSKGKLLTLAFTSEEVCVVPDLDNGNKEVKTAIRHAYTVLYPVATSAMATLNPWGRHDELAPGSLDHNGIVDFNLAANPQRYIVLRLLGAGSAVTQPQKQDYASAGFFKGPDKVSDDATTWGDFFTGIVAGLGAIAVWFFTAGGAG